MALNLRKGLKELLAGMNKGQSSKDALKSQLLPALPHLPPPTFNLLSMPNLQKKRKEKKGAEEGEMVPQKESKQQRMTRDKRQATSAESKEAEHSADMHHPAQNPRLKLDGTAVSWSSPIREFQRDHTIYVAEALEWPLLLPKDIDAPKKIRQQDLFMSLKRDLALVSFSTWSP